MKIYVNANSKLEDARSSASAFTVVGIAGIVILVLLDAGTIPIQLAMPNLIMVNVIMGILFLIFLIAGIHSILSLRQLSSFVTEEEKREQEILQWFRNNYKDSFSMEAPAATDEDNESEQYFVRYEKMTQLITSEYPDLKEEYVDHLIEILYEEIFQNDSEKE